MRTFAGPITLGVACHLVTTCLVTNYAPGGDDTPPAGAISSETVTRLMSVMNVIEQQHFDPPPKQELVRRLIQRMAVRSGVEPPFGIGRRLSAVSTDDALARELQDICDELFVAASFDAQQEVRDLETQATRDVLLSLQGTNRLTTVKEHRVQKQFASNQYVGIGIHAHYDAVPIIAKVIPEGPAANAGAINGDRILEIDGNSTSNLSLAESIDRIRGPEGTDVELLLQLPGQREPRTLTITRGVLPIKNTHTAIDGRECVISFTRITAGTVQELREIEATLPADVDQVTFDWQSLREWNQHHAVILADALLDGGEIGRVRTAGSIRSLTATREALFRDHDLAVLVSEPTAGTIEWVAAALQDRKRAMILGGRTAGQPFVTTSHAVPETDWMLELTTGLLERADGTPLIATDPVPALLAGRSVVPIESRREGMHNQRISTRQSSGGVEPDALYLKTPSRPPRLAPRQKSDPNKEIPTPEPLP